MGNVLCQKMSCCFKRKNNVIKKYSYDHTNDLTVAYDENNKYYNPYQYVDDKYNKKYYKDLYKDL